MNEKDAKIAELMSYIEKEYKIPALGNDVEEYTKNEVNEAVFDIYIRIANLREL